MKKMFTKKVSVVKLFTVVGLAAGSLLASSSFGQTYYSKFANPKNHYLITNPAGCDAPLIQDSFGMADNDPVTRAYFEAENITTAYNCGDVYRFNVDLNMLSGPNAVDSGAEAGFRIRVLTGINKDSLGKYLKVTTSLRDSLDRNNVVFQQYATGGGSSGINLLGRDVDANGKNWLIYFKTTKPFNVLELAVDPKIIQLNTDFTFEVFFAYGGATEEVLPAQIANFKADVAGKNVNISWQSLTETNVSSYRVERSNGNGSYSAVATLPARGNSNATLSYAFTDKVGVDGNYLYRIVTVNNDGSSKTSGSLSAIISGQGKLILYPTLVKAGQNVTVKTSETGLVSVYMFDAQGRLVKQQRTTSSGQFTIPTSGLTTGVYNVKVVSAGGAVLQSKIVVN